MSELRCPRTKEEDRWVRAQGETKEARNELARRRARERGLESALTVDEYGWLGYPREKLYPQIETIKLDDRACGNKIYLFFIPEIKKWVADFQWYAKEEFTGCAGYPHPLWSTLYNTREDALDAAWRELEKKGVKRPYIQGDLFGGDYS